MVHLDRNFASAIGVRVEQVRSEVVSVGQVRSEVVAGSVRIRFVIYSTTLDRMRAVEALVRADFASRDQFRELLRKTPSLENHYVINDPIIRVSEQGGDGFGVDVHLIVGTTLGLLSLGCFGGLVALFACKARKPVREAKIEYAYDLGGLSKASGHEVLPIRDAVSLPSSRGSSRPTSPRDVPTTSTLTSTRVPDPRIGVLAV